MELKHAGAAGTLESSDVYVEIEPAEALLIELDSTVQSQFGRRIREVIAEALSELGIAGARVSAVDKGALDCTIRARVIAAACRAADERAYEWR
ncbi:MAG: citrate lyase acyl carrier protein [Clostridia bacterium]|nr:citrate lyase acyl carrier protein [Clostridia bacterium]